MAEIHELRIKRKEINELKDVKKDIEKKLEIRQVCNKEIIKILKELVDNNASLRFCQILSMLDLDKDRFHEESIDTLKTIKDKITSL